MTFIPARAGSFRSAVIENKRLSDRYFLLRVERPDGLPDPAPGQFVQFGLPSAERFFLRRPFSVFDCNDASLDFLLLEVGAGTRVIRKLRPGDEVEYYGPLGNQFPEASGRKVLAVAGGVGLAPLYFYGYGSGRAEITNYRMIYGGRTRDDLFLDHLNLDRYGVNLSTDDGSFGFAGNVVELAGRELDKGPADVIYACGPTAMLVALRRLAADRGIPLYVSLENRMGCGMGACRACVVPVHSGEEKIYKTVCHDGPVFDAGDLMWDELPTP